MKTTWFEKELCILVYLTLGPDMTLQFIHYQKKKKLFSTFNSLLF